MFVQSMIKELNLDTHRLAFFNRGGGGIQTYDVIHKCGEKYHWTKLVSVSSFSFF